MSSEVSSLYSSKAYASSGWVGGQSPGSYSGPAPTGISSYWVKLGQFMASATVGKVFKFPKAYSFKGAREFEGFGAFGAGSTAGMKMNMTAEVDFSPSIFLIQKGLKEATSSRLIGRPLWDAINDVMIPSLAKNFDQGGRPTPWKPLRVRTMIMRAKQGWPQEAPILMRTRKLRNAALAKARWSVDPVKGEAVYGKFPQKAWYARIHQGGFVGFMGGGEFAGTQPIPPRPFAVVQEQDMTDIEEVFRRWLSKKLERNIPKARL